MPSLFDQISGFQFPDVLMNSGPLPSTAGGPAGSDGSIDGVINGTSALLENITPYAMGKSARTGSDRNYQQIPHRYPYIIPKLFLPDFTGDGLLSVSHAVDQGDIAFLLYGGSRAWWTSREQFAPRAPQCAFAGIDVVNYILACLQAADTSKWNKIRREFLHEQADLIDAVERNRNARNQPFDNLLVFHAVRMLVQQYFVPHGICAGSEHQGGQHETGTKPVQAAVNFVTTMTVDGKNIDLVNYWFDKNMLAGDELIFKLKKEPIRNKTYTLSAYYKDPQQKQLTTPIDCWQLVPDILRQEPQTPEQDLCLQANAWCHHKSQGYWRIAQTFQTRAKNTIHAFHRGMPLEVTFAPVWQSFASCRDVSSYGRYKVSTTAARFGDPPGTNHLCSVATKDALTFYYGQETDMQVAFTMTSSQNDYTIDISKDVCKVYLDGAGAEVHSGQKLPKRTLCDLHVMFDSDVKNKDYVPQDVKPHGISKDEQEYLKYHNYPGIDCSEAFKYEIPKIGDAGIGRLMPDYLVTIHIERDAPTAAYDLEFLRHFPREHDHKLIGDTLWADFTNDYVHATDSMALMLAYVTKTDKTASRPLLPPPARGEAPEPPGDPPFARAPNNPLTRVQVADLSASASLGAHAPSDSAEVAAKPPRKIKRLKFSLQPDAGPAEASAGE